MQTSSITVGIKKVRESADLPEYKSSGAAGFDLSAAEDCTIQPGEIKLIPTGLIFDIPKGHFLAIYSRSSTPKRFGIELPHSVGVIDSDYNGPADECFLQVRNFSNEPVTIPVGTRIAQGVIHPVVRAQFEAFSHDLDAASRGGFGSTGE